MIGAWPSWWKQVVCARCSSAGSSRTPSSRAWRNPMRRLELLAASLLLAMSPVLQAETQVQVVGLFPNAAVLLVDGQRKLVKAGQTGPGGVQVISADSQGARLRVDGVERSYGLTREYSQADSAAPQRETV